MALSLPGYVVPGQIVSPIVHKDEDGIMRVFEAGKGVSLNNVHGVNVLSSNIVGRTNVVSLDGQSEDSVMEIDDGEKPAKTLKFTVSVENDLKNAYALHGIAAASSTTTSSNRSDNTLLPQVGDVVLARVTRLTLTQANVEILAIENGNVVAPDAGNGMNVPGEPRVNFSSGAATTAGTTEIGEGFGGIIRVQDVRATERDKVKILDSFRPGDIVKACVISLGDGTNYYLSTAKNELGVIFAISKSGGGQMIPVDWQTMQCTLTGVLEPRKCAKP